MLTAGLVALGSAPASADVVLPFSLQGLFLYIQSPATETPSLFTATLTIDTTTGTVENFNSLFGQPMSVTQGSVPGSNTYFWSANFNYVPNIVKLVFATSSLIGYTGGPLVSVDSPDPTVQSLTPGNYTFIAEVHVPPQILVSGSVTPLSVPEPSSLNVLAAGVFGPVTLRGWVSMQARHRRRRATTSSSTVKAAAI